MNPLKGQDDWLRLAPMKAHNNHSNITKLMVTLGGEEYG